MMRLTYKYRLYPTKAQAQFLESQLRAACDLYNAALQERLGAWRISRRSINYYDQVKQLKDIRAEGLTALLDSSSAKDGLRRIDRAFRAFFRRCKRGQAPGFPRFKSYRRYDSVTYTEHGTGARVCGDKLRVRGAGLIKVKLHRPVQGKIKTVTIKREINLWYVYLSVECDAAPLPATAAAIGIDVGLARFAALSDGTTVPNPRHLREGARYLRRCQRRVARRRKGSHRRRKAVALLAKRHRKIKNRRANFHHQAARAIVNRYDLIAIEALNVSGLARGPLAKSVSDAGWGGFFKKLSYKAESAGRELIAVNPFGTSQICLCGAQVAKTLDVRWHHCEACGVSADRDLVSARVILQRARIERSRDNVGHCSPCVPREAVVTWAME